MKKKKQIYNNKLPEEKYFNDNIKVVYNDICNGTTYYIKNVTQSETRNYQTIVNSTIEEKATFRTFFTYYFTHAAKFCAYMGNYKNIKQYLDDNDRFSYHDSVERAVEYSLCALYNTYTNDMHMVIDGDDEGCDLGGLITNYYWMNVGPAPEWNNNIIYWLAHEGYDQICDAYCEKYNYGKGGVVRYRIKGGVLSTMMRDLEIFGDNAPGEFPMDDIWVQQFDYADIKQIYDRWVKHLVNRI